MSPEIEDYGNNAKTKALAAWHELLELGRVLAESDPSAPSLVGILEKMREEESQWPLPQDLTD
ncbi:MAG TPA: hypothetical protein EYP41_13905, partial [Anaerolineae bacterium]|nr:hypothetical protein [Anaerolineae bacterium]